ncbi:MAG: cytochrome P450 [Alphaproteobacteria bacterium]
MAEKDLPTGMELTPFNESFRDDPYPALADVQGKTRVYYDEDLKRYILLDHHDVSATLRDKTYFTDPRKANEGTALRMLFLGEGEEEPSMLFADDPDHARLRGLVNKAFTPRAVENMRPRAQKIVSDLLDQITETEFDFMEAIAGPMPTILIAEMLGIDPEHRADFKKWSDAVVAAGFNLTASPETIAEAEDARVKMDTLFYAEIEKRHAKPSDDLIGAMVAVEEQGDKFTEEEIVRQCGLLLAAGNVTTTDLIGNGIKALLDHPDQLKALQADLSQMPAAVEEILRYDSPVINSGRIPPEDVEISGCPIKKGESIFVSLAAANRDPDVYPDPDRFDISRENKHHQSFGGGRHFCLGAPLAKLEAQETLTAVLERFPNIRATDKPAVYRAVPSFRGMSEYWVRTD